MPAVRAKDVLAALAKDGWLVARTTGHVNLVHPTKPGTVQVPNHPSHEIKRGTLKKIIADADLTIDEFRALL